MKNRFIQFYAYVVLASIFFAVPSILSNDADHEALDQIERSITEIGDALDQVLIQGNSAGIDAVQDITEPSVENTSGHIRSCLDFISNRIISPLKSTFANYKAQGKTSALEFGKTLKNSFDIQTIMNTVLKKLQDIYAHAQHIGDSALAQKAHNLMASIREVKTRWSNISLSPIQILQNIRNALP